MENNLNSYDLSRRWFDFAFENPELISPNHVAIYFFAIEHCNRLGWKSKFGFPTQMAMDALGIKKHQTYIKYFNDLVEWGFFVLVQKSKNQYSSNIISLINDMPKNGKALDKAIINHTAKQTQTNGQSNSSINKQVNKETKNQVTKEELIFPFQSKEFMDAWNILIKMDKWKKKSNAALKMNLNKLKKHSESVAIQMIENTIAGEYQGLFEIDAKQVKKEPPKVIIKPEWFDNYKRYLLECKNKNNEPISESDFNKMLEDWDKKRTWVNP